MAAAENGQDILIYAELLANIRQISVKVTLPAAANDSTRAEIIDSGARLSISHDGAVKEFGLPALTPPGMPLPIAKPTSQELSWRLPLLAVSRLGSRFVAEHQVLPWTAADMKPGSEIVCRACNAQLVSEGTIETWKDLPSENWAEMMEFWHCHKPVDHKHADDDDHAEQRGYGANNTIAAKAGVGFIDISSFMLSESDCKDVLVSITCTIEVVGPVVVGGFYTFVGEIEGGRVELSATWWHGHRYSSPISKYCRIQSIEYRKPPFGWVPLFTTIGRPSSHFPRSSRAIESRG